MTVRLAHEYTEDWYEVLLRLRKVDADLAEAWTLAILRDPSLEVPDELRVSPPRGRPLPPEALMFMPVYRTEMVGRRPNAAYARLAGLDPEKAYPVNRAPQPQQESS